MLELGSKFLLSYFIGSLMGSMLVGALRGGVDIRTMGSGNAGGTNALRTQGWRFALAVLVIDIGKGAIGTAVVPALDLPLIGESAEVSRDWLVLVCAAATVIGHVWPMWHQFRGGKGAATLIGTISVLAPVVLVPVLATWALVLMLSGYVGLATITAGVSAPVYVGLARLPDDQPLFIYCVVMSMYLVFCHRANVRRMWLGEEHRLRRAMIFARSRRR